MRMPYKQDFIAALLAAKEQGVGAALAFLMAYLRGRYNGGKFWKTIIDALMCAMIAWFVRDLLDFLGLSNNLAYVASVFIGYVGTDSNALNRSQPRPARRSLSTTAAILKTCAIPWRLSIRLVARRACRSSPTVSSSN